MSSATETSPGPAALPDPPSEAPGAACCIAGANGPLGQRDAEAAAARFKALADPMRLRLLSHIAAADCHDVCVCTLTEPLGISQPTVSHHMKKLVQAGLVTREQRGRMAHFSIVPEAFEQIRAVVDVRAAGTTGSADCC